MAYPMSFLLWFINRAISPQGYARSVIKLIGGKQMALLRRPRGMDHNSINMVVNGS
jgi:hypothetical protein